MVVALVAIQIIVTTQAVDNIVPRVTENAIGSGRPVVGEALEGLNIPDRVIGKANLLDFELIILAREKALSVQRVASRFNP